MRQCSNAHRLTLRSTSTLTSQVCDDEAAWLIGFRQPALLSTRQGCASARACNNGAPAWRAGQGLRRRARRAVAAAGAVALPAPLLPGPAAAVGALVTGAAAVPPLALAAAQAQGCNHLNVGMTRLHQDGANACHPSADLHSVSTGHHQRGLSALQCMHHVQEGRLVRVYI